MTFDQFAARVHELDAQVREAMAVLERELADACPCEREAMLAAMLRDLSAARFEELERLARCNTAS